MEQTNIIYNEDCLETMYQLPDNIIDLTITSPPYDGLRIYDGCSFNYKDISEQLYRITKPGGVVVWIVGDQTIDGSETGTSFEQALHFRKRFNLHDTMIYQKDNPPPVGGSNRYYQHFEYMFVFSKGKPKTFNPIKRERRNKYNDKRTERTKAFNRDVNGEFKKKKVYLTGDVKIGNIWKYVVGGGNSVEYGIKHPATFPKKLVKDHLLTWTNEGDLVYDPFMGSGTTALVCKEMNRNYIGSEISEGYCKLIEQRLNTLF